jgi:hypothetical protein
MREYERNLLAAELMVSMAAREMRMAGANAAIAEVQGETVADFGGVLSELEAIASGLRNYLRANETDT